MAGPFTPETYQSGDGNLSEPILVGRLGQPLKLGGGAEFSNYASYAVIADRPSANDFGKGVCRVGTDFYTCDGVSFVLQLAGAINQTLTTYDSNRPVEFPITYIASPSQVPPQTTDYHGIDLTYEIDNANVNNVASGIPTAIYGFEAKAKYSGTGNIASLVPAYVYSLNTSSGIVDGATALRINTANLSTGRIKTVKGITIDTPINSGGGTAPITAYGLYVSDQNIGTTTYSIYTNVGKVHYGDAIESIATTTSPANYIIQHGTGEGIKIVDDGGGKSLYAVHSGTANGIEVSASGDCQCIVANNSAAGATKYAGLFSGNKFSMWMATTTDGGITTLVAKNGTGAGTALQVANKGTGLSINVTDGTSTKASIAASGVVTAPQYTLSALNTAPASATATGTLGEIRVVADFIYVCTATNTWVRTALSTW